MVDNLLLNENPNINFLQITNQLKAGDNSVIIFDEHIRDKDLIYSYLLNRGTIDLLKAGNYIILVEGFTANQTSRIANNNPSKGEISDLAKESNFHIPNTKMQDVAQRRLEMLVKLHESGIISIGVDIELTLTQMAKFLRSSLYTDFIEYRANKIIENINKIRQINNTKILLILGNSYRDVIESRFLDK